MPDSMKIENGKKNGNYSLKKSTELLFNFQYLWIE